MLNQMAGYDTYATFIWERPGKDFQIMHDIDAWQLALVYANEARIPFFAASQIQHDSALLFKQLPYLCVHY
jgi:hypothetical protein